MQSAEIEQSLRSEFASLRAGISGATGLSPAASAAVTLMLVFLVVFGVLKLLKKSGAFSVSGAVLVAVGAAIGVFVYRKRNCPACAL